MTRALLSPASAFVAHLEPLLADRKVIIIGNAERSLAEHVLGRGARLVQFLDPDPRRVAHAAAHNGERRLSYAQLTESALRDGSFDCAIVEDSTLVSDFARLVTGVARCLSPRGVAVLCASNPESSSGLLGARRGALEYDALCDLVDEHFETAILLGQSPFLGYSVVTLDLDHPPVPALDNAFLGGAGDAPDFYIALCGSEQAISELRLEEMSIVQLPAKRFVESSEQIHRERELRAARRLESVESELRLAKSRGSDKEVARLTSELEERDSRIRALRSQSEAAEARADDAEHELEELEKELEATHQVLLQERTDRSTAKAKLEAELKEAREQLKEAREELKEAKHYAVGQEALEEEVTALDTTNKKLESALREKDQAIEKLKHRLKDAEKELDELHDQLDETEDMLQKARSEAAAPVLKDVENDLSNLEKQLQERGARILELEGQLRKLETYAKTLTAELTLSGSAQTETVSESDLGALEKALAEREADLVAAQWTIGQLKQAALKD